MVVLSLMQLVCASKKDERIFEACGGRYRAKHALRRILPRETDTSQPEKYHKGNHLGIIYAVRQPYLTLSGDEQSSSSLRGEESHVASKGILVPSEPLCQASGDASQLIFSEEVSLGYFSR